MAMAKTKVHGIFCLETDWWGVKDRTTIEPVLQLLNTVDYLKVPYIHRDVGTQEEFVHYLRKWTGAVAVMGYRETTDWVETAAFEVLLLGALQSLSLTKRGMLALERRVRARAPGLCKQLGFRMVVG